MLLAICMIGTSETMNLGMNLGLDAKTLAHVINTSSGSNWACSVRKGDIVTAMKIPNNDVINA